MLIKNVLSAAKENQLTKQPILDGHSRQAILLHIPAGKALKPHVSKVDALLLVEKGQAKFTLWNEGISEDYEIAEHDLVAFRANQLHALVAHTDFTAFVLK